MDSKEHFFAVSFKADGKSHTAKVFPHAEKDGSPYMQVHFSTQGSPLEIIFVENESTVGGPRWKAKQGNLRQPAVSGEFLAALGDAIERQQY